MLPTVNLKPPFNITRASHIVLNVADLAKSREFYVDIVGLVVTEEASDICYLRGLSEACHHSLVLIQSKDAASTCKRIGFRVFLDEDLDLAYAFSNRVFEAVLSPVFDQVANTFVDAFVKRAAQVYGER